MTAVLLFLVQLPLYSATTDTDLTNIACTLDAQYSVMEIDGTGNNSGARYQCFFNRSESSDGLTTTMVADIYRDGVERTQLKMIRNDGVTCPAVIVILLVVACCYLLGFLIGCPFCVEAAYPEILPICTSL